MAVNKRKKTGFSIIEQTEGVKAFWKGARQYKVLSKAREEFLFNEIAEAQKTSDKIREEKAIKELVKSNERLLYSTATTFTQDPIKVLDYISEGRLSLMKAIPLFDITQGVRFMTFASDYAYREMFEFNSKYGNIVRRSNDKKIGFRVKAIKDEFYTKNEREPSNEEVKEILKDRYNIEVNDDVDLFDVNVASLDMEASEEGDDPIAEVGEVAMNTASTNDFMNQADAEYTTKLIKGLLGRLPERDREIVEMRYGINREYPMDPDDIADHFALTRTRVNQILASALKQMRNILDNHKTV